MTNEDKSDTMSMQDYLARGGKLTSPENVPARYRGELLRIMSSFVDSELAGSAGFAASINMAPGIKERIAASRITLEKADHAERVLDLMGEFGTDKARYNSSHDWAARLDREADLGAKRHGGDMRLSVFHYPLESWSDAVVMNVLMGIATTHQLQEMISCSYAPLVDVLRAILPRETRHKELGVEGLARIAETDEGRATAGASIAYWYPRVSETFGSAKSDRFERLKSMGLRRMRNEDLRAAWEEDVKAELERLKLN